MRVSGSGQLGMDVTGGSGGHPLWMRFEALGREYGRGVQRPGSIQARRGWIFRGGSGSSSSHWRVTFLVRIRVRHVVRQLPRWRLLDVGPRVRIGCGNRWWNRFDRIRVSWFWMHGVFPRCGKPVAIDIVPLSHFAARRTAPDGTVLSPVAAASARWSTGVSLLRALHEVPHVSLASM